MISPVSEPLSDFRILGVERVIDKVFLYVGKLLSLGVNVPEPDNTQREERCNSKMGGKLCYVTGIGQSVSGKRRNLNKLERAGDASYSRFGCDSALRITVFNSAVVNYFAQQPPGFNATISLASSRISGPLVRFELDNDTCLRDETMPNRIDLNFMKNI